MLIHEIKKEMDDALEDYLRCFDPDTGEQTVSDEELALIRQRMEEAQDQKDELAESTLKKIADCGYRSLVAENEINRLVQMQKREAKRKEKLENMIRALIPDTGKATNIGNFSVSYRKSEATIVDDEKLLPEEMRVKVASLEVDPTEVIDKLESAGIPFTLSEKAKPKADIKKWLESLSEEDREKYSSAAHIEKRSSLTIK